jgi:hypothetical protein
MRILLRFRYGRLEAMEIVVVPTGLEPVTLCLEGKCSIHLSYGTVINSSLSI